MLEGERERAKLVSVGQGVGGRGEFMGGCTYSISFAGLMGSLQQSYTPNTCLQLLNLQNSGEMLRCKLYPVMSLNL